MFTTWRLIGPGGAPAEVGDDSTSSSRRRYNKKQLGRERISKWMTYSLGLGFHNFKELRGHFVFRVVLTYGILMSTLSLRTILATLNRHHPQALPRNKPNGQRTDFQAVWLLHVLSSDHLCRWNENTRTI
uniref:Ion_trans_2 domain-containing protein n=1 Tax=Steinernema glaseri TaxID=37863 RepID=A0A1I7ZZ40_9BILA